MRLTKLKAGAIGLVAGILLVASIGPIPKAHGNEMPRGETFADGFPAGFVSSNVTGSWPFTYSY